MIFTRSPFRIAALVLLVGLFASNVYRAATQSIVHDEGLTWVEYLAGPAADIFHHYDANNHFLATILFKISTTLFGDSEFALRLPTVLAGAWFFWTVFRMCSLLFGGGWLFLIGCAALTLNPILLDFLVAARGYGLAMAGLFWGLYQMLAWLDEDSRGVADVRLQQRLWKAATGCCIAVAANLTFLMPVLVLAAAFSALLLRKPEIKGTPVSPSPANIRKKNKKSKSKIAAQPAPRLARLIHFVVPIIVLAVAFLIAAPIDLAHTSDFYAGAGTALASWRSLIQVSFAYGDAAGLLQIERVWNNFALYFFPLAVLAALFEGAMSMRRAPAPLGLAASLSSLALVASAILLVAAHLATGIPYPEDRTGIYFVPLATLSALCLARIIFERPGWPHRIGLALAAVLLSFAVEFAAQWNVKSFWVGVTMRTAKESSTSSKRPRSRPIWRLNKSD